MARKGGPALYELLSRSKGASGADGAVYTPPAQRPPISGAQTQVIAWVLVGVVAVVIAYLVGVNRGERLGRAALVEERAQEMQLLSDARPAQGGAAGASENRAQVEGNGIARGQPIPEPVQNGPLPPLQKGLDPREPGLNYLFIAGGISETSAYAIADFCRGKGLDAHVISGKNARLFEVFVLPGFLQSERSSDKVKRLEARIRDAGTIYETLARGNPDFGDMYHRLYQP
jgi:hypothetical protein